MFKEINIKNMLEKLEVMDNADTDFRNGGFAYETKCRQNFNAKLREVESKSKSQRIKIGLALAVRNGKKLGRPRKSDLIVRKDLI